MGGRVADDDDEADDCGKIHAALTLTRVTRIGQGHTHTDIHSLPQHRAGERDSEK